MNWELPLKAVVAVEAGPPQLAMRHAFSATLRPISQMTLAQRDCFHLPNIVHAYNPNLCRYALGETPVCRWKRLRKNATF